MSITRCLAALSVAAVLGGCASIAGSVRPAGQSTQIIAAEEVALLRLVEKVDAAALAHEVVEFGR